MLLFEHKQYLQILLRRWTLSTNEMLSFKKLNDKKMARRDYNELLLWFVTSWTQINLVDETLNISHTIENPAFSWSW